MEQSCFRAGYMSVMCVFRAKKEAQLFAFSSLSDLLLEFQVSFIYHDKPL